MKPIRKKLLLKKKRPTTPKRPQKSFTLTDFRRSFESLDTENYGSWPLVVKVTVLIFIVAFIAALSWALPISSKIDDIRAAESEQAALLNSYREKESRARHLQAYKIQVAQMETDFKALLDQLPKDTRVSELVEGINRTGVGSNIRFQDISVEPEIENEFFIEQPIRIAALDEYHQFGSFLSGLAALPRIITMHDFEVSNPQPTLDALPELNLVLQTKTYRSKEIVEDAEVEEGADDAVVGSE